MSVGSIFNGMSFLAESVFGISNYADSKLEERSPSFVILVTTTTLVTLSLFVKCFQSEWGKTRREQLGDFALRFKYVKDKYNLDINKELVHFKESVSKKWEKFGSLNTKLPEEGWSTVDLIKLINKYSEITSSAVEEKHLSGTIYSKSLQNKYKNIEIDASQAISLQEGEAKTSQYFDLHSKKLKEIFSLAYSESYLWNSLHGDEFSIGACIDYQVVRIVADMFGGSIHEVMGFVTSGGTESLMLAVRAYREWGIKNRGHKPGEGVIIASESVHAAIAKAGKAYLVNVVLVGTEEDGKIDMGQLNEAVKKYGNQIIAIVGSAPSYPTGVIDPIEDMAKIAQNNGCGMHVDCCLGGFIVNNLSKHKTDFLNIPGITSLSADTHKNGLAPKGSSVLVTKKLGDENLAYYSIYSVPDWSGGVYGTPKDAGSQSCVQSFNALLALLGTGKNGYQLLANEVHDTALILSATIAQFEGKLKLLAEPEVNVVAFQVDESWGLQKGATYAFANEMAKRNFVLNTMKNDRAHFCVTIRFASDPMALIQFKKAVEESLNAIKELNDTLIKEGKKFSGDAGMYCALEVAITPNRETLSTQKYVENFLLGQQGAKDAVRSYFLAELDPF